MLDWRMIGGRHSKSHDLLLVVVAVALGAAVAAGYAAWRAVHDGSASSLGEAMLFPGSLIIISIAAMVWLGWKANID